MKACVCKQFGPPEKLVIEEVEDPRAGVGELVVEVRAATVTFPDALMIQDKYQFKAPLPYIPGGEVTGVVCELGEGVSDFAVGDRVIASSGLTGGFAERFLASADATLLLYARHAACKSSLNSLTTWTFTKSREQMAPSPLAEVTIAAWNRSSPVRQLCRITICGGRKQEKSVESAE